MLSLLLLFSSFINLVQHDWKWSVHPESGFKVQSPVLLKHKVTEVPTFEDPISYHQYSGGSLQDSSLRMVFVIDHYKVSEQELGGDNEYLHEFFGVTVDQILKAIGGTLVYMDFTAFADREVCVWRASYLEGKGVIRGQLIIAGDKYYGLQAFGITNDQPNAVMNKFLDSFQMITGEKN